MELIHRLVEIFCSDKMTRDDELFTVDLVLGSALGASLYISLSSFKVVFFIEKSSVHKLIYVSDFSSFFENFLLKKSSEGFGVVSPCAGRWRRRSQRG